MDVDPDLEAALAQLRDDPAKLARYDLNGDGKLDEREWDLVRQMVSHEIESARERGATYSTSFEPEVLNDRYEVVGLLGRGGQAETFLARDRSHGDRHVVAKVLEIKVASDWKSIELFEREAKILEQLQHPRIPAYIDHFHDPRGGLIRFVVVQQFIDGTDLGKLLERGQTWTTDEAWKRLGEISEVLEYLHLRSPPVVHRDIKPSNLVLGQDDHLYLVDFGAAQNIVPATAGGSTIIGTSGYVPMEQYMGRAGPASDIYSLGATVLHMLSAVHPSDHEFERGKLITKRHVADDALRRLLDKMLQPHVEDRLSSAAEVRRHIRGRASAPMRREPPPSKVGIPATSTLRAGLLASAGNYEVIYHDPLRPFLKITHNNNSRHFVRKIYQKTAESSFPACQVSTSGGGLKVRVDRHPNVRSAHVVATIVAMVLGLFVFGTWSLAPGFMVFAGAFFFGLRTSTLDRGGWRAPGVKLLRHQIARFDVQPGHHPKRSGSIQLFDQDGRVLDRQPIAALSADAAAYLEQVLNGQLGALDGDDRYDPRELW